MTIVPVGKTRGVNLDLMTSYEYSDAGKLTTLELHMVDGTYLRFSGENAMELMRTIIGLAGSAVGKGR